ncbi:hypothetical protein Q8A67_016859 [Cirrhinus molitorella]|uniref:Uncharacterized protein n=1 Tax=Cirrhinus molitorella TaxID=172907 RepID=A0AA88TJJ7_9TELE|nr:hypothetical protein Q8A67_016859 [Cirrhinus molitorella]
MLSLSVVLRRSKNFTSRGAVRMPPAVPFNHGPGFGKPTKIEPESYSIIPSCGIQRRRAACFEHSNFFKVNVRVPPAETPSQGHPGDAARQGAGQAVVRLSTLRQPAPEDQPGSATSSFGGPGGEEREEREREGGGREPSSSSSSFFPHGPHGEGKALSGGRGDARDQSSLRQPRCASRGRVALGGSPGASLPPGRAGDQDPPGGRPRGRSAGGRTHASLPARTGVRATGPRNEAGVFLGRGGCHGRAEAQASAGGVAGTVPPSYPRAPSGPRAVPDRCVRPGVYASHEPLGRVGRLPHAKSEPGAPRPWRPPRRPGRDPTLACDAFRSEVWGPGLLPCPPAGPPRGLRYAQKAPGGLVSSIGKEGRKADSLARPGCLRCGLKNPSLHTRNADGGARFPAREGASRGLVVRPRKENEVTTQLDSPPREMPGAPTPGSIGPRGPEIRSPKVENGQSLTRYNSAVLRPNSSKLGSLVDLRGAYQTTPTPSLWAPGPGRYTPPNFHL